ncbi:MAG: metal-dependent transcriptional regulator [Promethearchaeota archaeon]
MVPLTQQQRAASHQKRESADSKRKSELSSSSIEEYLEAVLRLLSIKSGEFAKTGELAEMLGVAPASVTQMVQKLSSKGYLKYAKSRGVCLTGKGRRLAMDVLRRHRIAERLLVDMLGVSWEKAHEIACEWEHLLTPELCERVLERLDVPLTCPHGNPIPSANGSLEAIPQESLADLDEGEEAVIDCVSEESPELLRMIASMGMLPGVLIRVIQVSSLGDTFLVEVGTAQFALSHAIAERVRIRKDDD